MKNTPELSFPHPGEILKEEFLLPLGISQYRLAVDIGIPHSRVTAIIQGKRALSPDTALRLGRYFGNSPAFWLGLQTEFDLRKEELLNGTKVKQEVTPVSRTVQSRLGTMG